MIQTSPGGIEDRTYLEDVEHEQLDIQRFDVYLRNSEYKHGRLILRQ